MGDFKEEFEAWCSGDKAEPFEWHGTVPGDDFKSAVRYAWHTQYATPRPTLWQRLWRSPWTWLALAVNQAVGVIPHAHGWLGVVTAWGFLILFVVNFTEAANKRWGKP